MPLSWLTTEEQQILQQVKQDGPILQQILSVANQTLTELKAVALREERCCKELNGKLDQILQLLAPPLPVAFNVTAEVVQPKQAKK